MLKQRRVSSCTVGPTARHAEHPGVAAVAMSSTDDAALTPSPPSLLGWSHLILGVLGWGGSGLGGTGGGCLSRGRWGGRQRMHPMFSHPAFSHLMLSHTRVMLPAPIDLIGRSRTWQLESKVPISQTQTGRFINRKNIQSPSPSKACNLFYSRQPNFI